MAGNVAQMKKRAVAWQRVRVHARVYARVCVRVRMYVRTCEERDKLHFQYNAISLMCTNLMYASIFLIFSCRTYFCFK